MAREHAKTGAGNAAADRPRRRFRPVVAAELLHQGGLAERLAAAAEHQGFADAQLCLRWRDVVGPEIARLAQPARIERRQRRLVLYASSAASVLLQHRGPEILERLNGFFGRDVVRSLKFTAWPGGTPVFPSERKLAAARPDTRDLEPRLAAIDDSGLRQALLDLAGAMRRVRSDAIR